VVLEHIYEEFLAGAIPLRDLDELAECVQKFGKAGSHTRAVCGSQCGRTYARNEFKQVEEP
jgi:hypothetical protein